ncbi:formylmethanofuran dehydrogenase subunit C [Rhodopirellula rubra]|uniref:Formylmethanofuran dehydrogenase subunit C n=1 Tax=Aporhodopirellula rubra TaxID=980271 RepID=A0A7W5E3V7_9BACT|nr:formylmethanofuran dehydrogenase subunit C [Aporhodopirellula rubra]MBB3209726.1 formylmethanofuran dehydrogenase subunit C [Aporhodopirellula rubra]
MKEITLTVRSLQIEPVDVSDLKLDQLIENSANEIAKLSVRSAIYDFELGDLFDVDCRSIDHETPSLILRGDCKSIQRLGHQHCFGIIRVEGDIGDNCGTCMTGGKIMINGNAGDQLGGPSGARNIGMNGGIIAVSGSAGRFAGHRMRRGEIRIAGEAGDSLAAWQVAGTIFVGGTVGNHLAYGMRRGTVILGTPAQLPPSRFSLPVTLESPFEQILLGRAELKHDVPLLDRKKREHDLGENPWCVSRGDRTIGGIGEIWQPRI